MRRASGRRWHSASLAGGAVLGCALTVAAFELPYANWRATAPPVDTETLTIRQDAKGDGRFLAPRSGGRRHRGIDLVAELNSPVHAMLSGTVVQVGIHRGLGRFVELEHRHALHSLYAHLNDVEVAPGQRIRQGEVIGTVGKTGNARSRLVTPHVHLEVLKNGEPVDPQTLGLRVLTPPARLAHDDADNGAAAMEHANDASGGE